MSNAARQAQRLIDKGDSDAAVRLLREAARAGDTEAKFRLGLLYYRGKVVTGVFEIAIEWFEQAHMEGHSKAAYYLGNICAYCGDHRTAMEWYERSVERGYARALARIGICYLRGWGVERSVEQAIKHLDQAAAGGHLGSQAIILRLQALGHSGIAGVFGAPFRFCWLLCAAIAFAYGNSNLTREEMDEFIEF